MRLPSHQNNPCQLGVVPAGELLHDMSSIPSRSCWSKHEPLYFTTLSGDGRLCGSHYSIVGVSGSHYSIVCVSGSHYSSGCIW